MFARHVKHTRYILTLGPQSLNLIALAQSKGFKRSDVVELFDTIVWVLNQSPQQAPQGSAVITAIGARPIYPQSAQLLQTNELVQAGIQLCLNELYEQYLAWDLYGVRHLYQKGCDLVLSQLTPRQLILCVFPF